MSCTKEEGRRSSSTLASFLYRNIFSFTLKEVATNKKNPTNNVKDAMLLHIGGSFRKNEGKW